MIPRYRAFYEGKMYGVKAVIWTSRGLYVTLDEGNKAGRRVRGAKLMQSTGKMDSTGKVEVFVGDILYYPDQDEYNYGIIEFDEDKLAFVLDNGYEKFIYGDYGMDKVVGNIYQNKDLADYILGGNQ
ncbi:YopX family protein [Streptococcus suis]|uniref:YopX family protein n=1 Tax=Streptococcus suis TaxID=1307 RepID=UPI000C19FE98|nr:YopX family protein [Streptococcus suis]